MPARPSCIPTQTTRRDIGKGLRTIGQSSAGEYVRGDVHTNTIESYFATMKRGIIGTYHHVSQQHLKRYLCEFDFRYNERAALHVTDADARPRRSRASLASG